MGRKCRNGNDKVIQDKQHNVVNTGNMAVDREDSRKAGQQVLKEIDRKMRSGREKDKSWKSINGPGYGGSSGHSGSFSVREFIRDKSVRAGLAACGLGILIAFIGPALIDGRILRMTVMTLGGCISLSGVSLITRYISGHGE